MLEKTRMVNKKNLAAIAVMLVIMILSMTVISKAASNPQNHEKTIKELDEKKEDVLKLTAASVALSTLIAAVPGDSTTPVANKLADLSSYFIIVLAALFLEKYLVTLTGYAAFSILIPIACALFIAGICINKNILKMLAAKMAVFGIVIFTVIPLSMHVSATIEETYESTMKATVKEAQDMTDELEGKTDSEDNAFQKAFTKIKEGTSGILKKGEDILNRFIETIAVMIVTSCVIPIVVLLFMFWFVKILFGIQINMPKDVPEKIAAKMPRHK